MKSNDTKDMVLRVAKAAAVPLAVWAIMQAIDLAFAGMGVINNSADIKTLFRNLISSLAFALAIGANLNCGRMDLSLGAQMYAGVIFGGNIALMFNLGGIGVLILSMAVGALCGLVIGFVFIRLRILPMVLGLGMTLVFECMCFAINNQQGIILYGKSGVDILSNITFIVIVTVAIVILAYYMFQLSSYGFKYRAIQGSQKLAADAGINIYSNCVICYVIAGTLVACAGVFTTIYQGNLTPVLGMSSNGKVFTNMFPMVLGTWIGGLCHNREGGILMGSVTVNIIILGLTKLGLSNSVQNVVIYALFLLFVVYNTNRSKIDYHRARRARVAEARKMLAQKAAVH
ncbi:MAG: ABC transporter permease [Lachnospiraceae bacterium]|jgi:ribose transport system permease protein|nr:ABC transporter permease [Lachnospiraceae bacterium]